MKHLCWEKTREKSETDLNLKLLIMTLLKRSEDSATALKFSLCLQETSWTCLLERRCGECCSCFKPRPGTILKHRPIGLLLGSVKMGYPLNSTCSDIDNEHVCAHVCKWWWRRSKLYWAAVIWPIVFPSCVGGEMENIESSSIYAHSTGH